MIIYSVSKRPVIGSICKMANKAADFEIVPNKKAKSDIWRYFGLKHDAKSKDIKDGVAVCNLCKVNG